MPTYTCSWSTPSGKLGWTTIDECSDLEDAASAFFDERATSALIPDDAELDAVRPGRAPFPISFP